MSSLSSKTARLALKVAWSVNPLVRLSKPAGASVTVWLRTPKRDAVERASATTKNVTTDSFKIFIRSLLWRLGGCCCGPQGEGWVCGARSVSAAAPLFGRPWLTLVSLEGEALRPRGRDGAQTMGRRLPLGRFRSGPVRARRRVAGPARNARRGGPALQPI